MVDMLLTEVSKVAISALLLRAVVERQRTSHILSLLKTLMLVAVRVIFLYPDAPESTLGLQRVRTNRTVSSALHFWYHCKEGLPRIEPRCTLRSYELNIQRVT